MKRRAVASKRAAKRAAPRAPHLPVRAVSRSHAERAASYFRALADADRLMLLVQLAGGEVCVSELAETLEEALSTVSQRLRLLHAESLVSRRRAGKHVYYALADAHVHELLDSALDHASELR